MQFWDQHSGVFQSVSIAILRIICVDEISPQTLPIHAPSEVWLCLICTSYLRFSILKTSQQSLYRSLGDRVPASLPLHVCVVLWRYNDCANYIFGQPADERAKLLAKAVHNFSGIMARQKQEIEASKKKRKKRIAERKMKAAGKKRRKLDRILELTVELTKEGLCRY